MSGLISLYRGAGRVLEMAAPLWLKRRMAGGKEDPNRITERLGRPSLPRPDGRLVWVHAASVGETISVLPLMDVLQAARPDLTFLLTTATLTAAQTAEARLGEGMLHQYAPIDVPGAVQRFLRHWRPSILLLVESEIWPNMITMTKNTGARIALLNGHVSDRSFRRWQRFGAGQNLMSCIDLVLAQDRKQERQFQALGARYVTTLGDLKWAGTPLPIDADKLAGLENLTGDRPRWLAASTHPGEEHMIADAHISLREDHGHDNLLTIIAPRHPERGPTIAQDLSAMGLRVSLRSRNDPLAGEMDIYIADSLGELGTYYALCDLVFMGGSLVPRGGHNPLEAARAGCCIITGEHLDNFNSIYADLLIAKAAIGLTGSRGLAFWVNLALSDPTLRGTTGQRAKELTSAQNPVLTDITAALLPLLPEN